MIPSLNNGPFYRAALCILIAFIGGLAAATVSMPLPYMLGGIAATMFAAMAGAPIARPSHHVVTPMRVTLGVLLGSTMTPEWLDHIVAIAGTVATVPLFVIAAALIGTFYYERVAGYPREVAYFCALPGGLHVMTMYAEERGVDIRLVALAHALRITFVVILTTIATNFIVNVPAITVTDAAASITHVSPRDLVILTFAGLFGWWLGRMSGMPGALMLVPMVCSAVLHIAGVTAAKPPSEFIIAAQVILGANIGSRFVGEKVATLLSAMRYAFGHVIIMACLGAVFAFALNAVFGLPVITLMLSFAPGGMSEIGLIALALGLDVGFVATIQLCRLMSINMFGPYVYRQIEWMLRTKA